MKRIGKSIFGSVGYGLVLGLFTVGFALPQASVAQGTIVANPSSLTIAEGSSGTISVRLSAAPSQNVQVSVNLGIKGLSGLSASGALTFTSANYATDQTITITARQDDDSANNTYGIFLAINSSAYQSLAYSVTVTDDDARSEKELTFSDNDLTIEEGDSDNFEVWLAAAPSGDVVVTLAQPSNTDVTVNKTSLTFTTSNYDTGQTVTVSAGEDDDTTPDVATISLSASGGGYDDVSAEVDVTVRENDRSTVLTTPNSLTIDEGTSEKVRVKLSVMPDENVMVAVDIGSVVSQKALAANISSLVFTPQNWNQDQEVTITAAHDTNKTNDQFTIFLFPSDSSGYSNKRLVVDVNDDDKLIVSKSDLTVDEGSNGTFKVKLGDAPREDANVTVTLTSDSTEVTLNNTSLTFTSTNWSVDQTVTVSAGHDSDAVDGSASISLSASGGGYHNSSGTVNVIVADDDTAVLDLPSATLNIREGSNTTFTVGLDILPVADVTVTLTSGNTDVTMDKTSLTFTTSDWNTNQTVRVSVGHDDDTADETASIAVSATGGGYDDASGTVNVSVTDDDTESFQLPSDDVSVREGRGVSFGVKLRTRPSEDVTVTFAQPSNGDVTLDTDTTMAGNQTSLVFTTTYWDLYQSVRVTAVDDGDTDDERTSIAVSASGGGYDDVTGTVNVALTDDDVGLLVLPSGDMALDEGESATFDVKLTAQPTAGVTVTLTQPGNGDVKVDTDTNETGDQTTLTFTGDNWNTNQTVAVRAAEDGDTDDERTSISFSASGGGYHDAVGTVDIALADDDAGYLTLPSADIAVVEGNVATFEVGLTAQPRADVLVTLASDDTDVRIDTDTNATGNQNTLTFTRDNWGTARTVTVIGGRDYDTSDESASIAVSASGGGYGDATGTVGVDVTDDDVEELSIPGDIVNVTEGSSRTFTVRLATLPPSDVLVTLTQPSNTDVTVDTDPDEDGNQTTLTFKSESWNVGQSVTVIAGEDDDAWDESTTTSLSSSGGGYDDATGTVRIRLTDDDEEALTLSSDNLTFEEGSDTGGFMVKLATLPSADVTVTLTQPTNTDVTVDTDETTSGDQVTLTFTDRNWNVDQSVAVSVGHDDDAWNDSASISLSASGGGYADVSDSVSVAVTDDDEVGLTLPSSVSVDEGDDETINVRLATLPSGDVVVSLTQPIDPDVRVDTDTATFGNQTTLTFTDENWNANQKVTIYVADDLDSTDENAIVSFAATGGDYGDVTDSVTVQAMDDETDQLDVSATNLTVVEENSVTFTVNLLTQPSGNVTVTIAQPSPANLDVRVDTDTGTAGNQNTLVFTNTDWNVAKTVTVSTIHDHDTVIDRARLSLTASGGGYDNAAGLVKITVTDNDNESLNLPSSTLGVAEGGEATFTMSLGTQPSADVTMSLTSGNTDVTVDKSTLTFTSGNWNDAQTVTVRASQDPDASNESARITVSATGGGYDGRSGRVSVAVTDDDEEALTLASDDLSVTEGENATFDVKLATLPSANVSVTLTLPSDAAVTLDKSLLTFTGGNWNTAQRVTVSAGEDDDLEPGSASIALSASGGGYDDVSDSLSVSIADNDAADLTVSPTAFDLVEGGQSTFTVRLTQQPADDVSVSVGVPSDSDVRVDKTALTFTSDNWDTEQSVEASAGHDADAWDDGTSVITIAASGGGYDDVSESVSVDVSDDDEESLVLPPNALKVAEGKSGRFTVSLATLPSAAVSVTLTQPSNADVRVDADLEANGEQTQLTFTAANWNTPRTVTVIVGDDDDASNESASIALSATGGGYDGEVGSVDVDVEDDDTKTMVTTPNPLNFVEGESGTFSVSLATQPSGDVRVLAEQWSHNADISFDKDSLVFTETNWKEGQIVTVNATQDDDVLDDHAAILLSASGGGYDELIFAQAVTITDDDRVGVNVSPQNLRIVEGSDSTFTVRLARQPIEDVTVSIPQPYNTDVTIDKTTLTFNSGTWNTSQAVTVSAGQDDDDLNESAAIDYLTSGGGYLGIRGTVLVEVIDDDEHLVSLPAGIQGVILVNPGTLELEEDSAQALRVRLDGIVPTSNVTLVLTKDNPDITLSPGSLIFTPSDWNEDQWITVSAADDADGIDDGDTITFAAIGIDVPSRTVSVSVKDDDEPVAPPASVQGTIVVSPGTLVLGEGVSGTFTARLDGGAPDAEVSVSLSKTNDDVTISPQSLTFDSSNWDSDQVITVTLGVDADAVDDTDTITLSAVGGGYDGAMRSLIVAGIDNPGTMEVTVERLEMVGGGDPVSFAVRLGTRPVGTPVVIVSLSSSNPGIELIPPSLIFTGDDWDTSQSVSAKATVNSNRQGGLDVITLAATGGNYSSVQRTISVSYTEDGSQGREPPATLSDPVRAQALAMPSSVAVDQSILFIHCKQDVACTVFLDCSAQSDGSLFQGAIPGEIPARGTRRLTAKDIETYTGGSWSGKGRLGCALRSAGRIDSQVWTRSGDGVLVNNSAYIRSHPEGQVYRADIESITSPDGFERSNIRVRCTASGGESCTSTRFSCYADDGTRYESDAFEIGASTVRHVQSEELAEMIGHRWQGMGISCELRSDAPFTVQVLTRTGGGGALVNNSGSGEARIGFGG